MKKILALLLAMMMVLAMGAVAFATNADTPAASTVKIEIERDSSYAGDAAVAGRNFTWYKVFSASYDTNTSTVGGHDADGTPGTVNASAKHAAYTATSEVAAELGSWVAATGTPGAEGYVAAHWQKAEGNLWFTLTPIAGSTNYSVTWDNAANDTDTAQAAAKWLKANAVYEKAGTLTWDATSKKWTADGLDKGYYLVEGNTGDNLIAATTDVTIKEKNEYPPEKKTQADEDIKTYDDQGREVAIGDKIDYKVKVTIPANARVGDQILVWDRPTKGLTYNNDVATETDSGATVSDPAEADMDSTWAWAKVLTVTAASKGKDHVFKFSMTVNSDALVDTGKMNEAGVKFGREGDNKWTYESIPDKVEYKTYFAGIHKIDGETKEDLSGVEFTLKEAGVEFKVTLTEDGYYIYDANGSSTVVTDKDGMIRIRGLDDDKDYTLTETKTLPEYNMLDKDVTLTLHEDTAVEIKYTPVAADAEYAADATYYTNSDDGYVEAEVTAENFEDLKSTLYLASSTSTSSYNGATDDDWGTVENNKGAVLPSTGGIGTTIFYVAGSILVLAAVVLLVTKRRMNAGE